MTIHRDNAWGFTALTGLASLVFGLTKQKDPEMVMTSLTISSACYSSTVTRLDERAFHINNLIPLTARLAAMGTSKIFDLVFPKTNPYMLGLKVVCASLSSYCVEHIMLGSNAKKNKTFDKPFTTSLVLGAAQAISSMIFNQRAYEVADKVLSNIIPPALSSLRINEEAERSFRSVSDQTVNCIASFTLFTYGLALLNSGKTTTGGLVVGSAVPAILDVVTTEHPDVTRVSNKMVIHAINNVSCRILRELNPGRGSVKAMSWLGKNIFKEEILEKLGNPKFSEIAIKAINYGIINGTSSFLHQLFNAKDMKSSNIIISGFSASLAAMVQEILPPLKLPHGVDIDPYARKYAITHNNEYVLSTLNDTRFNILISNVVRTVVYEVVSLMRLAAVTNEELFYNKSGGMEEFAGNHLFTLIVCKLLIAGFDNNPETRMQVQEKMPGFIDMVHGICHELNTNKNSMSSDDWYNLREVLFDVRYEMPVNAGETNLIAPSLNQVL